MFEQKWFAITKKEGGKNKANKILMFFIDKIRGRRIHER
jgi:hypothetical protein